MDKLNSLPDSGVVFLGGHPNMTKKLKQHYPKWEFISDDKLKRQSKIRQETVFYWTAHGSHKLMQYTYSKLPENVNIYYVTATNIKLLIEQMNEAFNSRRCA